MQGLQIFIVVIINRAEPRNRIDQHGEKRTNRRNQDFGKRPEAEPDNEQRSNRNDGCYIGEYSNRQQRFLQEPGLGHQDAANECHPYPDHEAENRFIERKP
ncbi:hypothetical protein D3C75_781490 [compost metagenome]